MAAPTPDHATTKHDQAPTPWRAWIVVWGVVALHGFTTWGYTGLFWQDHGRWLYEITRFTEGLVPYRDITWSSPPLALWLVGGLARLLGTSLSAISSITLALYVATFALYLHHLRRLAPHLVLPIALPSFLFAVAYACRAGTPLPLGTNSPAGPVGFFCLLGATAAIIPAVDRRRMTEAVLSGVLAGLALLSRHDYWLPSIYVLAIGTALLARRGAAGPVLLAPFGACMVTAFCGLMVALAQSGPVPVAWMLSGSGGMMEAAVGVFPSAERLVVEAAATSAVALTGVVALWLCLAIDDRTAARWAGVSGFVFASATAVHLGMSISIGRQLLANGPAALPTMSEETLWIGLQSGRSLLSSALALYDERLQVHFFPVTLAPLLLGVLVMRWRSWYDRQLANRLALLLGLCVVARLHRGFRGAEWYHVLLELPSYALFLQLICGPATHKAARAVRAALSVVILLGAYAYISMGSGLFTLRGRLPATETHRGAVHWIPIAAAAYQRADSLVQTLDPGGERTLYAFGASGGWNYFLARRSPAPTSGGLRTGPWPLDTLLARIRAVAPPALLLDNRFALHPIPAMLASPLQWEPDPEPSLFSRFDRDAFEKLTAGCDAVGEGSNPRPAIVIYECHDAHGGPPVRRPGSSR